MSLITEIDRAVLELPEDLQVIWMRFRYCAIGAPMHGPAIFLFSQNITVCGANLYRHTNDTRTRVSGTALGVARQITEFFRDKTQQRCATEEEAV